MLGKVITEKRGPGKTVHRALGGVVTGTMKHGWGYYLEGRQKNTVVTGLPFLRKERERRHEEEKLPLKGDEKQFRRGRGGLLKSTGYGPGRGGGLEKNRLSLKKKGTLKKKGGKHLVWHCWKAA